MSVEIKNPDNLMIQQSEGQWMKYCMLLVHKFAQGKSVIITLDDITRLGVDFSPGVPNLLIQGHPDSMELSVVTDAVARQVETYHNQPKGAGNN